MERILDGVYTYHHGALQLCQPPSSNAFYVEGKTGASSLECAHTFQLTARSPDHPSLPS